MENEAVLFHPNYSVSRTKPSLAGRTIPLSMVHTGDMVRVAAVTGKDETRRFLGNIGFVEDAEVSVVTEINGNVIVNIKGTRVAISRSMANRVLTA